MRSTILSVILVAMSIFVSCSDTSTFYGSKDGMTEIRQNRREWGYLMTEDDIKELAVNLPSQFSSNCTKSLYKGIKRVSSFSNSSLCKSKSMGDDVLDDILSKLYLVSYDEGFAVISADTRVEQVLIYSESGSISTEEYTTKSGIYSNDGNYTIYDIIDLAPYYLADLLKYVIDFPTNLSEIDSTDAHGYYYCNPYYYQSDWITYDQDFVSVGGLWGQDTPYNYYAPLLYDYLSGEYEHAPIGCTAVAIGEVMRYYSQPDSLSACYCAPIGTKINIPWSTSYTSLNDDSKVIADLLKQIADDLPTCYSLSGSGANFYNIPTTLSHFGYNCNDIINYSINAVITGISQNETPIIMYGDNSNHQNGHAWVVGGYKRQRKHWLCDWDVYGPYGFSGRWTSIKSDYTSYSDYIYCNWGQNGIGNGYYSAGLLSFAGNDLSNNLRIITNIHPE